MRLFCGADFQSAGQSPVSRDSKPAPIPRGWKPATTNGIVALLTQNGMTRWLGAIPVLMPILQRLNIVEIINRYVKTEADVDSGSVALILALNRLVAPKPL